LAGGGVVECWARTLAAVGCTPACTCSRLPFCTWLHLPRPRAPAHDARPPCPPPTWPSPPLTHRTRARVPPSAMSRFAARHLPSAIRPREPARPAMKHAAPGAAAKVPLLSLARPLLITAEPLPIALSSLSLISLTPTPSRPDQPSPWPLSLSLTIALVRLLHPLSGVDCDRRPANR
jgi:hypothetical protein